MRLKFATASALVSGLGILLVSAPRADAAPGYSYSVVGNPADVVTATSGLLVLQGGGTDVDENFVRMGARSGGGDFVVIRASGTDAYNPYIYSLCSCDSVATIVFKNRKAAFQPFVIDTIRNAEALFIAGGDQSEYVKFWKNTPVEDAINFVAGQAGAGGRHQRGHGHHERVRLLGHEQQQPRLGGRPGRSLPPRPHPRPRLPVPGEARGQDHRPAPHRARPHGTHDGLPGSARS